MVGINIRVVGVGKVIISVNFMEAREVSETATYKRNTIAPMNVIMYNTAIIFVATWTGDVVQGF